MSQTPRNDRAATIHALVRQYSDATVLLHDAIARQVGLSGADHKYLGLLIQHGAMTAGEWARQIGLSTGAVTGLVDRLEKKNLVKRTFDENDRRRAIIVPNVAHAEQLLGNVFTDLQSRTAQLLASLSASEAAAVERYFSATIEIMRDVTQSLRHNHDSTQLHTTP